MQVPAVGQAAPVARGRRGVGFPAVHVHAQARSLVARERGRGHRGSVPIGLCPRGPGAHVPVTRL